MEEQEKDPEKSTIKEKEFTIKGLLLDPVNNSPIVILQDRADTTILPIWIGVFEANAIALELEHIETPRPMTHDLLRCLMEKLHVQLERIVVSDLREGTYYAEMHLLHQGKLMILDARPSDAIAMAVRTKARIFVHEDVIQKSRSFSIADRENWSEEDVKKWLESLSPDDLGKYTM